MGGLSSIVSVLPAVASVANAVSSISSYSDQSKQQEAAMRNLQAKQQAEYNKALQDAQTKRAEITNKAQEDEAARQAALKRAMARQRAEFGASGISTGSSGSAQALLLGLFDESEEEQARREELDKLRYQAINDDLAYKKRVNVLALDDLHTRQQIGGVSSLAGTIGKVL